VKTTEVEHYFNHHSMKRLQQEQDILDIRLEKSWSNKNGSLSSNAVDLQNAIDTLAKDLYSNQNIHFVMELIQNAEDNFYNPG
jgi:hypothetical protein